MQEISLPRRPLLLTLCAIFCLFLSPPGSAQVCGDFNCDGSLDIADMSDAMNFFVFSSPPPLCYDNIEFDGHANVNISDFLELLDRFTIHVPEDPYSQCFPLTGPLSPTLLSGNEVAISPTSYPSDFGGPLTVQLRVKFTDRLYALAIPFRVMIGTQEATIVEGSVHAHAMPNLDFLPVRKSGNNILVQGANLTGQAAGSYLILDFQVIGPFFPGPDPAPMTLELVPFPLDLNPHNGEPVHHPLFVFGGSATFRTYVSLAVVASIPCCSGTTGNVDCDAEEKTDISDLSALIDNLYISFSPLCCKPEANCDGSLDGNIDIGDLSALIDYLYISFTPTASCL